MIYLHSGQFLHIHGFRCSLPKISVQGLFLLFMGFFIWCLISIIVSKFNGYLFLQFILVFSFFYRVSIHKLRYLIFTIFVVYVSRWNLGNPKYNENKQSIAIPKRKNHPCYHGSSFMLLHEVI